MLEKKEKLNEKCKNELCVRMRVIRLTQSETIGDQFRYVRGKGLTKRNESVK
jgi:hypothetical protein